MQSTTGRPTITSSKKPGAKLLLALLPVVLNTNLFTFSRSG
jgi:hypothetical protein